MGLNDLQLDSPDRSYDLNNSGYALYYPQYEQTLYAISDRLNADSMKQFAPTTSIAQVHFQNNIQDYQEFKNVRPFFNRRILILVHGFNAHYHEVIATLKQVAAKTQGTYDTVIAYLYPGEKSSLIPPNIPYQQARVNALAVAQSRFPVILNSILPVARRVDVAAHSMGAFLAMNALNSSTNFTIGKVDNLFLIGAAIQMESFLSCSLPQCSTYQTALNNVHTVHNISSCRDEVLPWHTVLTGQTTAGRPKKLEPNFLSWNVKMIDASSIVGSHRDYLNNDAVIEFMIEVAMHSEQQESLIGRFFHLTLRGLEEIPQQVTCSTGIDYAIGTMAGNFLNTQGNTLQHLASHVGDAFMRQVFPLPYRAAQTVLNS